MVSIGTAVRMRSSVRNMALLGSALGSTLVVQPAAAQNQSFTGPTNYQNGGTISGGPTTVSATTATGDISLDLNTVIAANPGSGTAAPSANAIVATNTGTGNVTIKDVNASITGSGASTGIFATVQGGALIITQTGLVDATNAPNGRGISAVANGGTITINANEADGGLRGIYTGSTGNVLPPLTTINVVTAQSTGAANQPNAIIAQGDRVILNSGTASLTNSAGTNGTAIFVNAGTSAVVTAGTTNAFGQGQAGIIAAADGTLDLTSNTVHTTQNSDGISIQGGSAITVRSGTILLDGANSGVALVVGGNHGGNFTSGPNGIVYNSATVTSSAITTAGANSYGIYATPNGGGTTAITSGTITTTGAGATGIYVTPIGTGVATGATTIASTTINASGAGASGIVVNGGQAAPVAITSGTIAVTGGTGISVTAGPTTIASTEIDTNNGSGIAVQGTGLAMVTSGLVKNAGTSNAQAIAVQSDAVNLTSNSITGGGSGISVNANGAADTTIASGSMALTSVTSGRATSLNGIGLSAIQAGTGNLAITSGSLVYTGTGNTVGITAQAVGGGALTITSGTVAVTGNGGYGILGYSSSGAVNITTTGNTTTTGTTRAAGGQTDAASQRYADGIDALSNTGAISVTNSGTISTAGATARGIEVEAGRAKTTFGAAGTTASTAALSVTNTGTVMTGGQNAIGIKVQGDANPVTVASNTVTTSGNGAYGIGVSDMTGPITVSSANIATRGDYSYGIYAVAGTGAMPSTAAISLTSTGALTTSGGGAEGIYAYGGGPITVANSGTITTMGPTADGIAIIPSTGSGPVTVNNSGSINANGAGIFVPANASNVTRTIAITSNAVTSTNNMGISVEGGTGSISVVSTGPIVTGGPGTYGYGIHATGTGAMTVTASDVRTNGQNATAIQVNANAGGTGAITVQAGTVRATGVGVNILADTTGTTSPITVSLANATTAGSAVSAIGAGAVNVTAGTTRVAGNAATAINAISSGGLVTVASTDLGVTAGRGIFASGATGATVTSTTLAETSALPLANGYSDYALIAQVSTPASGSTVVPIGVTVNSGTLTSDAGGIRTSSLTANTMLTSGSATVAGYDTAGISALATTGNVAVTSNAVTSSGAGANAIYAQTTTGNIAINTTVASTTGGFDANTGNSADAVIAYNSFNGTGTIAITSGTASATGDYASAIFARGGGAITINSGTASASGAATDALGAVSGTSDVTIAATTTTAIGAGGVAIGAAAAAGNVTINAGSVSAVNGRGIDVTAGHLANVTAGTVSAGGDGYSAVSVTAGTGATLAIGSASSTGALTSTTASNGTVTTSRADAIYAAATTGTINAVVGSATATGANADAIHLIANGTGGGVTLAVNGAVSSTGGYGVFIDPPGANSVTVASGASVSGALAGIDTVGATNSIVNLGTIGSSGGPGILASGTTTLDNSGTIAGANGVAVQLGATNDTVILRTGSAITGAVAGGGGTDAAVLIGTNGAASATQSLATLNGFDSVTVQSGYWTAAATNGSAVNRTAIASGAAFEVANGAAGIAGYASSTYADNGTLVVRSASGSGGSTFGAATVTGTGGVRFTGAGTATLDGTNSLQNSGTNTVDSGATVLVTGTQGGSFVNNGTVQIGNGGTTGNFTGTLADNGTLISNRSDSYTFAGALTGNGIFVKQGTGSVVFGSNYGFTGTTVLNGGSIRLSTPVAATTMLDAEGTGTYDLSGNTQTIAQLSGASTGATVNIANGALTVNQAGNTSFAGSITGNGSLTKSGAGSLNLTGVNTYAGPTTITGGRLAVNGSITSPVTVFMGGTLGGNGTVGSTTVATGGIFAPGNSIGTLNVAGNVAFAAGSIYQVEANAAGQADRTNVTGTATLSGGTVQVLAASGVYAPLTSYTILTAAGGVTGQFAGATSNLAFLTPALTYGANAVTLSLGRNDISFASQATAPNGVAVANAVAARGLGDTLYNAVLVQTANGAGQAFNRLSGEIHATIPTAMIDSDRRVRDAVLDRARVAQGDGLGLWMQGLDTYAYSRDQAQAFGFHTNRIGVYGGIDYAVAGFRIGVSGGYFDDKLRVPALASRAEIETDLIGGSISYAALGGRLNATAGVTQAWHHVDTTRTVDVPGLAGAYIAAYRIRTTQAFGELGFALLQGPVSLTPFVRYDYDRSRADGFAEIGGPAALNVAAERRHNEFGTAGARIAASYPIGGDLVIEPHASAAYLRTWDRLYSTRLETFGATGPAFAVTGDRLGRDNLDASGGIDLVVSTHIRIGATGYVMRSSEWRDYGGKGSVSVRF